ncbi:MAG: hypothetical protein ACLFPE_08900 [Bacteroidales bacterium]
MRKKGGCLLFLIAFLLSCFTATAQIGLHTDQPDASAELDIFSTNKGVLIPRVELSADLSDPSPVTAPAQGLLVFNAGVAQQQGFYTWSGTEWKYLQNPTAPTLTGPGESTNEAVVRFDGNSGKLLQNSTVLLDDTGILTGISHLTANGFKMPANAAEGRLLISNDLGQASWGMSASFNVKKDDILIASNISQLNFSGGSTVLDEGSNKASVAFYNNSVTGDLIQLTSRDSINLNSFTDPVPVPWNMELHKNAAVFIHSNAINPSRIQVRKSGLYEINYIVNTVSKTMQRKTLRIRLRKNGTDYIPYAVSYSFSYNMADFESAHNSSSFLVELLSNDYVELVCNGQTNSGPLLMISDQNVFFMRIIREY